ncbi:hypothetical protein FSP39_017510 [Pinctada imbricata]|uniref:Uncharacterized protein n=1 Tax=Pinctada imbricata TaxID=66713 RepID=A0AA88Y0Y1_PINIB|nr:hypothetical protein FSP39_017510 [Pinctada imbricata]
MHFVYFQLPGGLIVKEKISSSIRIYNTARQHLNSKQWALHSDVHGSRGKDKSHMFVSDVLREAGLNAPSARPWFYGYAPIPSSEWGNRHSPIIHAHNCYHSVSVPILGDIVAFPNPRGHTHVGIVSPRGHFICTSDKKIIEMKIPTNIKRLFWRYKDINLNEDSENYDWD